jgi:hypothetical protein
MIAEVAPEGDLPSFVLWLLSSRRKLTRFDRQILIDLLEQVFILLKKILTKPIKKRGPPQQRLARLCGTLATNFYQSWKDANRRNGINDWGHRKEMQDEACRLVIGLVYPRQNAPTFEQVRELIERPAARREYRE